MPIQGRSQTGIINIPVGGGIVVDDVPQEVTEPTWTDGLNVRFRDGFVSKTEGYDEVLTAPSAVPYHVATLQTGSANYWVHTTATGVFADDGTTKTTITGTALTGGANKVSSCVLGGVLILNNQADVPRYWGGTGNTAALTGWTSTERCGWIRSFRDKCITGDITKSGVRYPSMLKWSHSAAPGFLPESWDEGDPTKDAGEQDAAETDDFLVDGLALGNTFVVYKERSAYGMQALENNLIFRVFRLPGDYGALALNCVANTPKGHVVLTNGPDVVVHYANEPRSIIQGKWRRWLEANIDTANYRNSFVFANTARKEVWICIPTTGNTYCNRALVWNHEDETLTLVAIPNLTHAAQGRLQSSSEAWSSGSSLWSDEDGPWDDFDVGARVLASSGNSKLYLMDEGDTADGTNIAATITRTGLHFGDPEQRKLLRGVVLRVDATAGTVLSVEGASSDDAEGPYAYTSPVTYTVGTSRRADFFCSGRFVGVRISSAAGNQWRLKSIGYDVKPAGAY